MSTLQEFLIKSAGMEKAAINAVSLRNLVASLPLKESIKRFGKKRVNKINAEIENAAKRYTADNKSINPDYISVIRKRLGDPFNFDSKLGHIPGWDSMAKNVPLSQQGLGDAFARRHRRDFKNVFFDQDKFMTREQLLLEAKRHGVDLNPNDLKHNTYHNVLGAALDAAEQAGTTGADIVRLNAQLPQTVGHLTDRLNTAVAGEVRRNMESNRHIRSMLGSNPKRSIRNALDIVRGQNVFEPGTRANRLYKRIVHGAKSSKDLERILDKVYDGGLLSDSKKLRETMEKGENAFFHPLTNSVFVAPKGKNISPRTELHERSHMAWNNLPPQQHLSRAKHYLTRLNRSAAQHKLNIPWEDSVRIQEYLADAAAPTMGSPGFKSILKRPTLSVFNAVPAARINLLNAPDDVRRGLLQLQMNYHHPVFKAQDSVRRNLP